MPVEDVPITDALVDGVLAALGNGRSDQDVALEFDVTLGTVEVIRGAEQDRRNTPPEPERWSPQLIARLMMLKRQGASHAEIAERLGRSLPAIAAQLCKLRKRGRKIKRERKKPSPKSREGGLM